MVTILYRYSVEYVRMVVMAVVVPVVLRGGGPGGGASGGGGGGGCLGRPRRDARSGCGRRPSRSGTSTWSLGC